MFKIVQLWDPNRQESIANIRNNIQVVSGIVIMGNVEADTTMLPSIQLEELFVISNNYNIPIHIITAGHVSDPHIISKRNLNVTPNNLHIHYWTTYYLTQTLVRLNTKNNYPYNQNMGYDIKDINCGLDNTDFQYHYICLNKAPKRHRMLVMDSLAKYELFSNGAVTFRELNQGMPVELHYWQQQQYFLDQNNTSELFNQEILPKEYQYSFMQLVTESHEDIFFLTEKTAIPLLFNKPFLVASSKHFHKRLEELGFKLYDELFDYSFDEIDDLRERMDSLVKNIDRYKNKTKEELQSYFLSVKDKLVYNKRLAIKYATDYAQFPTIWNNLAIEEYAEIPVSNPLDLNRQIKNLAL